MDKFIKDLAIKVRNGLFLAPSRTYGEKYIEPLIRKRYNLLRADDDSYDAKDENGKKYEIKASKVLSSLGAVKNAPLIDRIALRNDSLPINRLVPFDEADKAIYVANVQNVKRDHFDYLIYALLFADCIKIFKVEKNKIKYHVDNFLTDTITYDKAAAIYQELSK